MVASKRIIMVFFFAGCGLILSALLGFAPRSEARAWQGSAQSADDCATCHEQAVDLLADSLHAGIPLKCDNCHKLVPGAEGRNIPSCIIPLKAKRIPASPVTETLRRSGTTASTAILIWIAPPAMSLTRCNKN